MTDKENWNTVKKSSQKLFGKMDSDCKSEKVSVISKTCKGMGGANFEKYC